MKTKQWKIPTSDVLLQHAKRTTYQASVCTTSHVSQPTPESWGWKQNPVWTVYPANSLHCMHGAGEVQL